MSVVYFIDDADDSQQRKYTEYLFAVRKYFKLEKWHVFLSYLGLVLAYK